MHVRHRVISWIQDTGIEVIEYFAMYSTMTFRDSTVFYVVKIETAANRKSIMSKSEYDAYCDTFRFRTEINRNHVVCPASGAERNG